MEELSLGFVLLLVKWHSRTCCFLDILGINEGRNVMQICALICLEHSDYHFLTVSDSTHIMLCYAKIFCIYVKDLLEQNGLQEWKGNYRQRIIKGIMSRGVKMRKGILIL